MVKFGGSGKSKQCCINRKCPNMLVQEANDDDINADDDNVDMGITNNVIKPKQTRIRQHSHKMAWLDEPLGTDSKGTYYEGIRINDEDIHIGDCVMAESEEANIPAYIAKVNIEIWFLIF